VDKYALQWVKPTQPVLQNVTVTGPPETIDMLDQLEQPTARLSVKPQDVGGDVQTAVVKYDLPEACTSSTTTRTAPSISAWSTSPPFRRIPSYNTPMDLQSYVNNLGESARRASQQLVTLDGATKVAALRKIASAIRENRRR
jgi:hypothetical protein